MNDILLRDERNQKVVKANSLIQKTRYELNLQEQKMLLYIISKIKPNDKEFSEITLNLRDICSVLGININGKNYRNFKNSLKSLRDKSFWMKTQNNQEILLAWLDEVKLDYNYSPPIVKVTLNKNLKPYLIALRNNFTSYELSSILAFKSKFSIRIYELIKSFSYNEDGNFELTLENLKEILNVKGKYREYKDFRKKVLDVAIEEINKFSDLNVNYKPIRINRRIQSIIFSVEVKKGIEENLTSIINKQKALDPNEKKKL